MVNNSTFAILKSSGNVRVQGSSYKNADVTFDVGSTGIMEGFFFDVTNRQLQNYADAAAYEEIPLLEYSNYFE
jgi:hypothetical protein